MSDLWSLAAFRLKATGRTCADVATKLNQLPQFKKKRGFFDADAARKAIAEGQRLVEETKPLNIWAQH
jgi:hypothetical protein